MILFRQRMEEIGMADTRAASLAEAVDILHRSVSQMDEYNLAVLRAAYPGIFEILDHYGEIEELRQFKERR